MVTWENKDTNHASSENIEATDDPDKLCEKKKVLLTIPIVLI